MIKNKSRVWQVFALALSIFTMGCAHLSSPTGGLQTRMEVEGIFESGTILADHTYYTEGPLNAPVAIIAISNAFQLQTNHWSQREWTAKDLTEIVSWMRIEEFGFCTSDGGVLIAPDGQQVGIWYSKKDTAIIRQPAPGVVEVFPFFYGGSSPCKRWSRRDSI